MKKLSKKSSRRKVKNINEKKKKSKARSHKKQQLQKSKQHGKNKKTKTKSTSGSLSVDKSKESEKMLIARKNDSRTVNYKEKAPEAVKDHEIPNANRIPGTTRLNEPKNIEVTNHEVDDKTTERVYKKLREKKKSAAKPKPIDAKSKLLMDRVPKKPYRLKNKPDGMMLCDEPSTFYRTNTSKKKLKTSLLPVEDSYDHVRKLEDIKKEPEQDVYKGQDVPTWAVKIEPTDDDMKETDEAITVSTDHLEMYRNKKLSLKSIPPTKLVLNELQPLVELKKRDEVHFETGLVFSNTIRSLLLVHESARALSDGKVDDEYSDKKVQFDTQEPEATYIYSRINPIESAKAARSGK